MTRLFLGVGRRRGIRPGDVVGAIAGEARIPGEAIGAIEIADQFTSVEVASQFADHVLSAMRNATIKGRPVSVRKRRSQAGSTPPSGGVPAPWRSRPRGAVKC
jgi:ATP-dependent RNA helicase DeaD